MEKILLQPIPKMASMREVQRNYRALFDWVRKTKNPLVLTSGSSPYVVVLNFDTYHRLIEDHNAKNRMQHNEEWEKKWKRIRENLAYIQDKGRQDVCLSEFIIQDREKH